MLSWGLSKYTETKLQTAYFHFIYSFFLKKYRKVSGTSLPASFLAWFFWGKYFSWYVLLNNQMSDNLCFVRIGQCVYCNCLLIRLWRHKSWNWFNLFNQVQDKNLNILGIKRVFKLKQKTFVIIFNCLSSATQDSEKPVKCIAPGKF